MSEAGTEDLNAILEAEHQAISDLFRRVGSAEEERGAVLGELIRQLAGHISIEHSLILPVVRHHLDGDGGHDLSGQLKAGYREMQKLLIRIERRKPNSPDQPELVDRLDEAYARHCLLVSTYVRPGLETDLSGDERAQLRDKVVSAQGLVVSHPHPHLLPLGPFSRLTTRVAGRYDRIRDRVSGRRAALGEQHRPGS